MFNYQFAFTPFCPFLETKKIKFQQAGRLVTRNISALCLKRVVVYFKDMPNSIDIY